MHQRHVAPRPLQAVLRAKPQTFGADIKAVGALPARQPPDNGFKLQRPELDPQPGVHIAQGQIGHSARKLAAAHVGPGPKRTVAAVQLNPQRVKTGILPDARDVNPDKVGIQLSCPCTEVARVDRQQRAPENAPETETLAPFRRWRGVQTHEMAMPRVAHHAVDLAQRQRRCLTHFIGPAHRAAAQDKLSL